MTTNIIAYILINTGGCPLIALTAVNVIDSIVPISRFNKGEASKIFADVKKFGTKIVVKNNTPECVLMSPRVYQDIMEEYENAILIAESRKRLSDTVKYIDHKTVMEKYGLSESDLDGVEVNLE